MNELQQVISIVKETGEILLRYFKEELEVSFKDHEYDPVTKADKEGDMHIRSRLMELFPRDQILSEEHDSNPDSYSGRVWVVDPLDGTKYFIKGMDSFSVCIGLLVDGVPTLGVVYAPARKVLYFGSLGEGSFMERDGKLEKLSVSSVSDINLAKIITRHKTSELRPIEVEIEKIPCLRFIPEGSGAIKICRVASGDVESHVCSYFKGSKWDTIAGEVILKEAGGIITDLLGNPLDYTKPSSVWDKSFVASNNESIHKEIIDSLRDKF